MDRHEITRNNSDMLELLSSVEVDGKHGYVCARSYPSTSTPSLYDVRFDDGQIEKCVPRERIVGVMPPTYEQESRIIREVRR